MIDIHAHYVSPSLLTAAEQGQAPVDFDARLGVFSFPSGPTRPIPASLMDLENRETWIQGRSIDLQLVSPWMDIAGDDLIGSPAREWCRLYNDTMAGDLGGSPMFKGLGALPMDSGDAAAEELTRVVSKHGFLGGAIPTQVRGGVDLDIADLDPLFATAQELGVPLLVHPYRVMARSRMDSDFLFNICGNPFETTLAAMRLFFWGVFDKWPDLKLVLAHTGGALSLLAGRAWHASNHTAGFNRPMESPGEMLDGFYYDTLLHDPLSLGHAIRAIGPSQVMAGTDSPFPMLLDGPIDHIKQACELVELDSAVAIEAILTSNAKRVFQI